MVKTKANQKIKLDKLQSTLDKLDRLKEKPKSELTLRESIYFLRDKLKSALKKGYSYEDLSEILEEQEILISASTLKQYLTELSKESTSRKKRSQSVKSQKSNLVSTVLDESSLATSSPAIKKNQSQAELDKDLSKKSPLSNLSLERDLEGVQSELDDEEYREILKDYNLKDSEIGSSKSKTSRELNQSESQIIKSTKRKSFGLSENNRDLSEDFNQF
jgi:hypothetical protein